MQEVEEVLKAGRSTHSVIRVGDTIRRSPQKSNPLSRLLLIFLEEKGFDGAPRFLGIDEHGRDILRFIPGEVPVELHPYDDSQIAAAARLMRRFHDATSRFPHLNGHEVICHNDWSPPNCVFVDRMPAAMIDFDNVEPGSRLWDFAYTAHTFLNLGSPHFGIQEQRRRLRLMAEAYGLDSSRLIELVVHITARLASGAKWAHDIGTPDIQAWLQSSRDWVAVHLLDPLLPSWRKWTAAIRPSQPM